MPGIGQLRGRSSRPTSYRFSALGGMGWLFFSALAGMGLFSTGNLLSIRNTRQKFAAILPLAQAKQRRAAKLGPRRNMWRGADPSRVCVAREPLIIRAHPGPTTGLSAPRSGWPSTVRQHSQRSADERSPGEGPKKIANPRKGFASSEIARQLTPLPMVDRHPGAAKL